MKYTTQKDAAEKGIITDKMREAAEYELTCKIFENDVESLKKQWFDIIEDKEVI